MLTPKKIIMHNNVKIQYGNTHIFPTSVNSTNMFEAMSVKETNMRNYMSKSSLRFFIIAPGIFLTVLSCIITFVWGNRREIMAYPVQGMMPIMQETMEQMTPF